MRLKKTHSGFTLLEVVISVAILAFISIFVAKTINRGLEAKTKIQRDIDRTVALREALSLMSRDVQLAFHYRDIGVEIYNKVLDSGCKKKPETPEEKAKREQDEASLPEEEKRRRAAERAAKQNKTFSDEVCAKRKEQKVKTEFIGEGEKLDFATTSNIRTQRDEGTSDQSEVGYYLKDCRTAAAASTSSSKCLWRRVSPILDDKPLDGGSSSVLLEHVKSLSFRYLSPGESGEWVKSWRTDGQSGSSNGDSKTAGQFPFAVEMTLEIEDTNVKPPKTIGRTVVAPIKFTNNPPVEDPNKAVQTEEQQ